jgi:tetratricopeptide (TPR) repeat protein
MRAWLFLVLLVLAAPVRAAWLVAETAHFRVYGQMGEKPIRERAAMLEDFRDLLMATTSVGVANRAPEPKLDLFIVRTMADAVPFGRVRRDVAGFYVAVPGGVAAYATEGGLGLATLLHEYAHHFMLASGRSAYPAWYVEGFAEYYMTATFKPDQIEMGQANMVRVSWLVNALWLPMEDVLSGKALDGRQSDSALFYAQSWAISHYLFRAPENAGKLDAYLKAVSKGADPVEAFKEHVEADLEKFQKDLRRYLFGRPTFTRFKRSKATPALVTVKRLDAEADDLLLPLASLERMYPAPQMAERVTAVIAKGAARHPGEPMAERGLALLALKFGERSEAVARLDALLARYPDDAALLRWRAAANDQSTPEGASEARRYLARSFKASPDDWRTLHAYVLARGVRTRPLSETEMDVMETAAELAPQVTEISLDLALAYAHLERLDDAAWALAPVAHNPHGGALREVAATLLEKAQASDGPGFFAIISGLMDRHEAEEEVGEEAGEEGGDGGGDGGIGRSGRESGGGG